jgi:DNA-binding LacI/PurR family transcriptional regulator
MARPDLLYQHLLDALRQQFIASFSPGEPLPSQRALALMHGVGQATVNRALHTLAREGMVKARPRLGWVRSAARGATAKRRHSEKLRVGIITRRGRNEVANYTIYEALEAEAKRRGIEVVYAANPRVHHPTPGRNRIELSQVAWNSFDVGLLVEVEDAQTLSSPLMKRRPVVAVDLDATEFGIESVTFDDYGAGRLAARHLFELGHRRFAITDEINDPGWPAEITWLARRHGFEAEAGRMGGCIWPQWRIPGARSRRSLRMSDMTQGVTASWAAMPPDQRPTALFAVDQSILETLIPDLARKGIRVPRDLSVMIVDWSEPVMTQHGLQYTCIQVDLAALVRRALDVALELTLRKTSREISPKLHTAPVLLRPGDTTTAVQ